jgi:hypothetical protein
LRFIITQDEATWLRNYYAVELDADSDDPESDARDKLFQGECDWIGFDVQDNFENAEKVLVSIEQTEDTLLVTRPAEPPDAAKVAALVAAVKALLVDAIDQGEAMPGKDDYPEDEDTPWPRDDEGNAWWPDYFDVYQALAPFATKEPKNSVSVNDVLEHDDDDEEAV